ncbi:hypothetical protein [Nonomuraea sp. PA05]|nr:hypothetical protein [Nonomuraea sp. PA05]
MQTSSGPSRVVHGLNQAAVTARRTLPWSNGPMCTMKTAGPTSIHSADES